MHFALGLAALAGVSQAFLLPPNVHVNDADKDVVNTLESLSFDEAAVADERVMEVNCPGCPIQTTNEGVMHWGQAESVLRLNFTIVHNDVDALMANGVQIYPIDFYTKGLITLLTADQLVKSPDNTWVYSSSPKLGYSLKVTHPLAKPTQDQLDLLAVHLDIIEVGNKFVHGIPSIDLKLLETFSGKLMLGDAKISTAKSPVPTPSDDNQECTTLLCKWKAIVADRLAKLKGNCGGGGGRQGHARPTGIKGGPRPHGHGLPRPHGPHRGHRRPHHSALGRFSRGVVLHILIPVLIGICVGITASLVGMVFGHIAIFVWRLFFRRGERGQYTRVEPEDVVVIEVDDETKEFIDHQGPPPVYEEAFVADEKSEQK